MSFLLNIILVVQVLSAVAMIVLVLIQHGKGADMGAAFGSGSSGSLFGASGSANFLSRTTAVLATVFFVATMGLALLSNNVKPTSSGSVLDGAAAAIPSASSSAPAAAASGVNPAAIPGAVPVAPTPAASGAAQIPGK